MAEPISRSQILQQQIDNLQKVAPPAISQAERDQIMKGRKSQADIDAGRKAIADRERAISDHNTKVNDLLGKLDTAAREEGTEATRRERESNASPFWNTYAPSVAGAAGGAALGEVGNALLRNFTRGNAQALIEIGDELGPVKDMTNSQMNRSISSGAAKAAERYAPARMTGKLAGAAGRIGGYAAPAGVVYNEFSKYQARADDQSRAEADRLANQTIANGLLGASTGIALDGGLRVFYPPREPGEGRAMARINAARDYATRMDAADETRRNPLLRSAPEGRTPPTIDITPQQAPAPAVAAQPSQPAIAAPVASPAAQAQAERLRHSERLSRAVAAAGGKAGRGKSANYQALAKGVTSENIGAVAKALDLPSGTGKSAILQRARELMNTKGVSAFGPLVAGATGALAAMSGDAKAADGTPRDMGGRMSDAAVAGGAAGGIAYGANRLLRVLPATVGPAMSMMGPMSVATMDEPEPEVTEQYRNLAARTLPRAMQFGAVDDAYNMAQVPEPSPYRQQPMEAAQSLEVPQGIPAPNEDGSSPYGEDGGGEDDFETQMAELQTMLAEIGAGQEEGPAANAVNSQRAIQPMAFQSAPVPQNRMMPQAY